MSYKTFFQAFSLILILGVSIAVPMNASAGGVCGGTYIADPGDTVEKIAAICGTSAAAIYAANPGITSALKTGQALIVPGNTPGSSTALPNSTALPLPTHTPTPVVVYYPPAPVYVPPVSYTGYYTVQFGDTFSAIASRFGIGVYNLWAANSYIWDINRIYVGQVLYIPGSSYYPGYPGNVPPTAPTKDPVPLSYGEATGAQGTVTLSNKANADVYVSLQGTTNDGTNVIREYPVDGKISARIPAAWYTYVAWVGGVKFVGGFHLGGGSEQTITFYKNEVVVD